MPLGKFLKRDKDDREPQSPTSSTLIPPDFKFIRSDTHTQDVIYTPAEASNRRESLSHSTGQKIRHSLLLGNFRKSSGGSSNVTQLENDGKNFTETQWEEKATLLAKGGMSIAPDALNRRSRAGSVVSLNLRDDETIQEAIRLHEAQRYGEATVIFEKLANPNGGNNVLSQVIYALCLRYGTIFEALEHGDISLCGFLWFEADSEAKRHGWGCDINEARAAEYLRMAAENAADVEQEALSAGMSKGGAAKGELVLAIYELANCYRQGWGVQKDLKAAFQYYLTAANLGDSDAMNEVALCYLEGFGTKKNKFEAARYYRLAESKGNKTVGNSWIYKDKYVKYEKELGKRR